MERPQHLTLYDEYTLYRPIGDGDFAYWMECLTKVFTWSGEAGVRRLLVDASRITGLEVPTTFQRFQFGERSAEVAGPAGLTIAMVLADRIVDPERFGETVARNRGLQAKVFTDEVAALEWLVGADASRPVLATARTDLRWLVPSDAAFIQELVNQPSWLQNIGERNVHDLAGGEAYIRNGPRTSYARHGFGLWAVVRREGMVPLGICGILQREYLDAPDIGYAFLERHQGQGYGTEVTAATLAYAREHLGISRMLASVLPSNAGSIKILERIGMRRLKTTRMPGDDHDVHLYGTG